MSKKWLGRAGLALGATAAAAWVTVRAMASVGRRHDQEVAASYANRLAGQVARADKLERSIDGLEGQGEEFEERREAVQRALSQARAFLGNDNLPVAQSLLDDVEGMLQELAPHVSDEGGATEAAQQ